MVVLVFYMAALLFTYLLLTPWNRILLEKLTGSKLIKKFPAFYGTWRFIIMFTRAWHLSLFWARLIQSMPHQSHFLKTHFNITLPSAPQFSKCFLSLRLPHQNPVCPSSLPVHATCPAHPIPLDMITQIIFVEEYRSLSSSLCSFLHLSVTSSLWGPNILLSTLFSNTLSLCSPLNLSDQVSHPYKKKSKIVVLYILIFVFLDSKLEDSRFCTEW